MQRSAAKQLVDEELCQEAAGGVRRTAVRLELELLPRMGSG